MSCGVGRRCSSDPALLWLWYRLAATALIRPLAREPPDAVGKAQEMAKKDKKKKKKKGEEEGTLSLPYKDTARRLPSATQGQGSHESPTLLTP